MGLIFGLKPAPFPKEALVEGLSLRASQIDFKKRPGRGKANAPPFQKG
jgi:hypothetical protein